MIRCKQCNKKTSVLLDCKCENKYCTKHIQPEVHQCVKINTFREDRKKFLKEKVEKEAEAVSKQKVDVI